VNLSRQRDKGGSIELIVAPHPDGSRVGNGPPRKRPRPRKKSSGVSRCRDVWGSALEITASPRCGDQIVRLPRHAALDQLNRLAGVADQPRPAAGMYKPADILPVNQSRMYARWKLGQAFKKIARRRGQHGRNVHDVHFKDYLANLNLNHVDVLRAERIGALPSGELTHTFKEAEKQVRFLYFNELIKLARTHGLPAQFARTMLANFGRVSHGTNRHVQGRSGGFPVHEKMQLCIFSRHMHIRKFAVLHEPRCNFASCLSGPEKGQISPFSIDGFFSQRRMSIELTAAAL
jgi:hypothetical protein